MAIESISSVLELSEDDSINTVAAALPWLDLPIDHPRQAQQAYSGASELLVLTPALTVALRELSQEQGTTVFTILLAALQTLLYRYSGQQAIPVGCSGMGSAPTKMEDTAASPVNRAPVCTDVAGDPPFHELLRRVCTVVQEAFKHQGRLTSQLPVNLPSGCKPKPAFQVVFQIEARAEIGTPGNAFSAKRSLVCEFDLSLSVLEQSGTLHLLFEYNAKLFEAATVKRMAGHFQTLLEAIVNDPRQALSALPLLTAAERHQLLVEWNEDPPGPIANEPAVCGFWHQLFEAQAQQTPDAVALVFEDNSLTYRELNRRANQLAHYLRSLNVGPETLVSICMERSIELVVGVLGVLKAGGACVPMDPAYPAALLAFMLKDSGALLLLTQSRLVSRLPALAPPPLCLDTDWHLIAHASEENPASFVSSENLSFVFYTSGSSGWPKAVMWQHGSPGRTQSWAKSAYQLTAYDNHLLKTPIGFTLLSAEIFLPLLSGARLVILPPAAEQDGAILAGFIAEHRISIIILVPSMLSMLLDEPRFAGCACLRQVICFGESLSVELEERLFAHLNVELNVFYGTTEAPSATFRKCVRAESQKIINIGRRRAGKRIYILDGHQHPVPVGIAGELYIGGAGLARGYLNLPELNAERFILDPFNKISGARIYKTGDRARYLPNGDIEYLGRSDQQVNLRGFRIELGQIEAALNSHPEVRACAVIVREDIPGDQRLVAYAVRTEDAEIVSAKQKEYALRVFLKEKLPDYMLPSAFVFLDVIPVTPHGKTDRKGLPVPDHSRPELEEAYVAPRTPDEQRLSEIWSEVLKIDKIGIYDNFFELGGHSLLATQVISRIRTAFQIEVPLGALFENPTIVELAKVIVEQIDHAHLEQLAGMFDEFSDAEVDAMFTDLGNRTG